jgi:hypothetical protein
LTFSTLTQPRSQSGQIIKLKEGGYIGVAADLQGCFFDIPASQSDVPFEGGLIVHKGADHHALVSIRFGPTHAPEEQRASCSMALTVWINEQTLDKDTILPVIGVDDFSPSSVTHYLVPDQRYQQVFRVFDLACDAGRRLCFVEYRQIRRVDEALVGILDASGVASGNRPDIAERGRADVNRQSRIRQGHVR